MDITFAKRGVLSQLPFSKIIYHHKTCNLITMPLTLLSQNIFIDCIKEKNNEFTRDECDTPYIRLSIFGRSKIIMVDLINVRVINL